MQRAHLAAGTARAVGFAVPSWQGRWDTSPTLVCSALLTPSRSCYAGGELRGQALAVNSE